MSFEARTVIGSRFQNAKDTLSNHSDCHLFAQGEGAGLSQSIVSAMDIGHAQVLLGY